jgi:hypothetical protein
LLPASGSNNKNPKPHSYNKLWYEGVKVKVSYHVSMPAGFSLELFYAAIKKSPDFSLCIFFICFSGIIMSLQEIFLTIPEESKR